MYAMKSAGSHESKQTCCIVSDKSGKSPCGDLLEEPKTKWELCTLGKALQARQQQLGSFGAGGSYLRSRRGDRLERRGLGLSCGGPGHTTQAPVCPAEGIVFSPSSTRSL